MGKTFVYVENTKGVFCVCRSLDFCAFVSFVSIVHVFLKRHFLLSLPYEFLFRHSDLSPVGLHVHKNGAGIHKRHKSLKVRFIPIPGGVPCTR